MIKKIALFIFLLLNILMIAAFHAAFHQVYGILLIDTAFFYFILGGFLISIFRQSYKQVFLYQLICVVIGLVLGMLYYNLLQGTYPFAEGFKMLRLKEYLFQLLVNVLSGALGIFLYFVGRRLLRGKR